MNQFVINIAYVADNQSTVTELVDSLKIPNVHFNLINASDFELDEDFRQHLVVEGRPCLLMVSDNFLKSSPCLINGLSYLQALIKNEQVIPIIIDGVSIDRAGKKVRIPTEFEKVSNVIKYMNFWQEKYLDLRKLKRGIPAEEEAAFLNQLKVVRSISSEVGEYLRNLRDTNYYSLEAFSANHYEAFFRNFGDEASHLKFIETTGVPENTADRETLAVSPKPESPTLEEETTGDFLPLEQLIIEKEKLDPSNNTNLSNQLAYDSNGFENEAANKPEIAPSEGMIQQVDASTEDIEKLISMDPEWASISEEAEKGEINSDSGLIESPIEELPLNDTELLALELSSKLPKTKVVEEEVEGYFVDEDEEEAEEGYYVDEAEEEEMISLEDLMGKDFLEEVKEEETTVEEEVSTEMEVDIILNVEEKEVHVEPIPVDLPSDKIGVEETLALAATEMSSEEDFEDTEEELEGYFVDEDEDLDEIEEELNEFDVLESANKLVESGKTAAAILLLKETLADAPDFVSVRFQYAAFLAKYRNDFTTASNQLGILLEQEPNNLSAKFFLGELAEAERDYLTAKGYYEKVYEENPDFPNVTYKLGTLLVNHIKESPEIAADYFRHAYQHNPNNINALYQLGILQSEELNQEEEAIDALKEVLKVAPEHPFANYDLAIIYHNQENRSLALQYYVKAALVNPELKTIVNDQAFAIAREEMEATTVNESGQSENALADTSAEEELQLEEITTTEALVSNEVTSPVSDLQEKEEAFEFPFPEPADKEDEEEPVVIEKEEIILPKAKAAKIALITGATSGIGRATATKLAEEGYQLILTGRRFSRLFQLKDQFEKAYNSKVRLLPFDIKDSEAVQAALAELETEWQSVDVLINNAGLARGETAIHEGEFEHWDNMIDTNVKGLLYVTREIAPYMVKKQKGQIINVCSLAGKEIYPNNAVYCATKHAVDALTKAMRVDLHKYNIRVSQVSPGFVEDTEFAMVKHEHSEGGVLGFKPVSAQDVADVIYFMLAQPAHVNLQEIVMTGTQQATANIIAKDEV